MWRAGLSDGVGDGDRARAPAWRALRRRLLIQRCGREMVEAHPHTLSTGGCRENSDSETVL